VNEAVVPENSVVPVTAVVPFFCTVKFVLVIVAGSIATLNVAEIFALIEKSVALLAGSVDDTVGRTPGSSSLSQAENNTIDSTAMIGKTFLNFIVIFFSSRGGGHM
jgi:hypothetical protein